MRWLLPPIVLAAGALYAQASSADPAANLRSVDECLARLAPEAAQAPKAPAGIGELRLTCPDLEQAINDSDLREQLPEHWQEWLDRSTLADVSWQLHHYQPKPQSTVPRVPTLYQVARSLNQPQPRHTRWQDFKDWLRQLLLARDADRPSMLNRWMSQLSLPALLLRSILYGLLGAIVVMALWIIRRELQAAGGGAGAVKRALQRSPGLPSAVHAQAPSLTEIDTAPPRQQPALLLRLLIQALLQSGRLGNERSLTHRELGVRSTFDDAQQQLSFQRISLLAERLLYGAQPPAASAGAQPQIDQALMDGRQLYAQLLGSRADAR